MTDYPGEGGPLRTYIAERTASITECRGIVEASIRSFSEFLDRVDPTEATCKPSIGVWSVNELLAHSIEAKARVTRVIRALTSGIEPPDYNVPDGIAMTLDVTNLTFAELVELNNASNAELAETVGAIPLDFVGGPTHAHGYFGPMTALEWAGFLHWHEDDHAKHARSILASVREAGA